MPSVNKVILVGHLGSDPELKYSTDGKPRCQLSVATNHSYKDKEGNWQEKPTWTRVVVWGERCERMNTYLNKGRQVYIEGRLHRYAYTDPKGEQRFNTEVNARLVLPLGPRPDGMGRDAAPGMQDSPAQAAGADEMPF